MLQAGRLRLRFPMRSLDFSINIITMTPGSTQPLTQMSTRNLSGVKGRPTRKTDYLTAICEPTVKRMWEPRCLTNLWASTACYRELESQSHIATDSQSVSQSVCLGDDQILILP
jgi:hypothetical protein